MPTEFKIISEILAPINPKIVNWINGKQTIKRIILEYEEITFKFVDERLISIDNHRLSWTHSEDLQEITEC